MTHTCEPLDHVKKHHARIPEISRHRPREVSFPMGPMFKPRGFEIIHKVEEP